MTHVPPRGRRVETIDAHTAGEPLRIIVGGLPDIPGDTMLAKRRFFRTHHDDLRRALMLEPRGHADMYGAIPTDPVTPDGDLGVLFLHNEGYSTMCGHGIIALVTVALECGLVDAPGPSPIVRVDTPAGRVTARAHREGVRVAAVSFVNVPSFAAATDVEVAVPDLGAVRVDLAFGGAFYAYVDARAVGVDLAPASFDAIVDVGRRVKHAVAAQHPVRHPLGPADLDFLYGTILVEPGSGPIHSRNVCVFADGQVDRCPTGTGVSGRAALLHARGELPIGREIVIESLIGTTFGVRALSETNVGDLPAIVPEVTGAAWITGHHEFVIDPDDPLRDGLLLR